MEKHTAKYLAHLIKFYEFTLCIYARNFPECLYGGIKD